MNLELESAFRHFNSVFFDSRLKHPVFVFDATKKFPMRWTNNRLVIGSEIVQCSVLESLVDLLHEMIHIQNHKDKIIDLGINQYHKKEFLQVALSLGFYVIKHRRQGWCLLSTVIPRNVTVKVNVKIPESQNNKKLSEVLEGILKNRKPYMRDLSLFANEIQKLSPPKPFLLKYECRCPAPHNSIRSGRRPISPNKIHPSAMCKSCNSDFICTSFLDD